MRTREEILRCLNEISNQLIELSLYDLSGKEKEQICKAKKIIEGVFESMKLSKNELKKTPQAKESKGYFWRGYYYEHEEEETKEDAEAEALASGVALSDFYGPDEY